MRAQTFRRKQIFSDLIMWFVLAVAVLLVSRAPMAQAETTIGGHIGFVLPLVTRAGSTTTNIADHFSIGFPLGVTFKGNGRMAYDLELVPGVQGNPIIVIGAIREHGRPTLPCIRVLCGTWDTASVLGYEERSTLILRNGDLRHWSTTAGRSRTVFSRLILLRRSCQSVSTAQSLVPRRHQSRSVYTLDWDFD